MSIPISATMTSARAPLDAGDRAEQINRHGERGELLLDPIAEQADVLIKQVEVGQDRRHDQRVLSVETTDQGFLERRDLLAQLPFRELREYVGVGGAERRARRASLAPTRRACRWRRSRV